MNAEFAPLLKLGRAERLQLVEDLWDSLAEDAPVSPVTVEQLAELRRRKERFLQQPTTGLNWEQVKSQARASA